MVLCSPSNPSLSSDSSESGLAHSWYLYYLENRKSTRSTSIFFQFSHAYIHSFLTLFLRHFLSTKGEDTDYLGTTYLVSGLSNSEKGQQDKYMCDTWEGHQVSVWLILAVSRYTQKKICGAFISLFLISLGEQALLGMLIFCLYNGSSSPARASGNTHSLLFFYPYDSHEPWNLPKPVLF